MSQPPRLEIRNIVRSFGGRRVVSDVSLAVMPGQVTCLLGPSGCGKSTTLRIIAGVEMQDSGSIWVEFRQCLNEKVGGICILSRNMQWSALQAILNTCCIRSSNCKHGRNGL